MLQHTSTTKLRFSQTQCRRFFLHVFMQRCLAYLCIINKNSSHWLILELKCLFQSEHFRERLLQSSLLEYNSWYNFISINLFKKSAGAVIKRIYFMLLYKIHHTTIQKFAYFFSNIFITITKRANSTLYIFLCWITSVLFFEKLYCYYHYFPWAYILSAGNLTNTALRVFHQHWRMLNKQACVVFFF